MERFKCPVAVHIFLMKEGKLFLQLRNNTSSFAHQYYVLAGHIEGNETFRQTAIREAFEETGIIINKDDLKLATICHTNTDGQEYIQIYYWCDKWQGTIQNLEPDKCTSFGFFPITQLPDNIVPQLKIALSNAQQNNFFYELM